MIELLLEQYLTEKVKAGQYAASMAHNLATQLARIQQKGSKGGVDVSGQINSIAKKAAGEATKLKYKNAIEMFRREFDVALKKYGMSATAGHGKSVASAIVSVLKTAPEMPESVKAGKPAPGEHPHDKHVPEEASDKVRDAIREPHKKPEGLSDVEEVHYKQGMEKISKEKSREAKKFKDVVASLPDTSKPRHKKRILGGKDKTLYKVNSKKEKTFKEPPKVSDDDFKKGISNFYMGGKKIDLSDDKMFKFSNNIKRSIDTNVPQKYITILERMMSSKKYDEHNPPISFFTTGSIEKKDGAESGLGTISSQSGELISMIATVLPDKDSKMFFEELNKHVGNRSGGEYIIDETWIKAAEKNRNAIHNYLKKEYIGFKPEDIVNGSWDVQDEVSALGLHDPKNNKGNSTDFYLKVKTKTGEEHLVEVSLKKGAGVNFLNSGATESFPKWVKDLPEDIDPKIFNDNERELHRKVVKKFKKVLPNALKIRKLKITNSKGKEILTSAGELREEIKKRNITLEEAMTYIISDKTKKPKYYKKIVKLALDALAENGDKTAEKYSNMFRQNAQDFKTASLREIASNDEMKEGMLESIKSEFPLKSISEGEEIMAVGEDSLDKRTLKTIFGTNNWKEIKERLITVERGKESYIAYDVDSKGTHIPIATIDMREKGIGYNGNMSFDMKLNKDFAKKLKEANGKVYGSVKLAECYICSDKYDEIVISRIDDLIGSYLSKIE